MLAALEALDWAIQLLCSLLGVAMDFERLGQGGTEAVRERRYNSMCFSLQAYYKSTMFLIQFNRQEIALSLSLRSAMSWLCDSEQVTLFLLNRTKAEGWMISRVPHFLKPLNFQGPNSSLSQIWPLAIPAAITHRSNLVANHLLQFPYFL